MATYFVASGGSNTAPYDTWAKAATSLATALTAATSDGDKIIIQYNAVPSGDAEVGAATTYTATASIAIISASNDGGSAWTPTEMGTANWIGNSTASRSITIRNTSAGKYLYLYGLTVRTAGASTGIIYLHNSASLTTYTAEKCYLWCGSTSDNSYISLNAVSVRNAGLFRAIDCTFRFGHAQDYIGVGGVTEIVGGSLSSAGTIPTSGLFTPIIDIGGPKLTVTGMDISALAGNELINNSGYTSHYAEFVNCKLGSNFIISEAETSFAWEVYLFNCSSGDEHYQFYHYNVLGQTSVSTGIYATDAAANNKYDGTNRCSWKIITSSYANYFTPYVSPWFETYHSGTSAITPSIEILRDGSSTAYQDDEVWGEWSYQGTTGYTLATIVNDRMALAGTAANQTTGALSASNWTGENATAWFGKLAPASTITPAEIGMLRARVCVGEPSITVYVDPTVRYA